MAANKFATLLHRSTNKMVVILVYTVLEWALIALLLLNGLFAYLITKFAAFFGLRPPCIFCSRLDHIFEPDKSHLELLCDSHASEVSKLGYCPRHRKLAEVRGMCDVCSPSDADRAVTLVSWITKRGQAEEDDQLCSCCDAVLDSGFYSPSIMNLKSSWGASEITQKAISEEIENGETLGRQGEEENCGVNEEGDCKISDCLSEQDQEGTIPFCFEEVLAQEGEEEDRSVNEEGDCKIDDYVPEQEQEATIAFQVLAREPSFEVLALHSENMVEEVRLVPVELIDMTTLMENHVEPCPQGEDDEKIQHNPLERDSMELTAPNPIVVEESSGVDCSDDRQYVVPISIGTVLEYGVDIQVESFSGTDDLVEVQAPEEDNKIMDVAANCEISIGSEICDQEPVDQSHFHEPIKVEAKCSEECNETTDKEQAIETEPVERSARGVAQLSISLELNEVEDERTPNTPISMERIQALHKRLLFDRRESGTESLDGSVASEVEGGETLTVDQLKSALIAERKALSALYAEFEEERTASSIATNHTMAMITRLQEEKAVMKMETLQYQRMMEEQSVYDQEALELLNELMMTREKEKENLEKELELYRKKVLHYEAKERRNTTTSNHDARSGFSSTSSNAEDSDGLSLDSHGSNKSLDGLHEIDQNCPLDDSLADFEEERLLIVEQIKALEEKLITLEDEEPFDNLEATENCFDQEQCTDQEQTEASPESVYKLTTNQKKLAVAEEIDNVYERLQSLESDREFLKNCIRSLKKGDKGMVLLQEILRHLRYLSLLRCRAN